MKKNEEDSEKFLLTTVSALLKMTGHCVECIYWIKASRYCVKDKYTEEGGVLPKKNSCDAQSAQMDLPLQDK